jgi:hypothetical protein
LLVRGHIDQYRNGIRSIGQFSDPVPNVWRLRSRRILRSHDNRDQRLLELLHRSTGDRDGLQHLCLVCLIHRGLVR